MDKIIVSVDFTKISKRRFVQFQLIVKNMKCRKSIVIYDLTENRIFLVGKKVNSALLNKFSNCIFHQHRWYALVCVRIPPQNITHIQR